MSPEPDRPALAWRVCAAFCALLWTALSLPEVLAQLRAPPALLVLALGAVALVAVFALRPAGPAIARALERTPRWTLALLAIALPTALTAWLQRGPMRGQTLAYDSSVYVLQARALAHGVLGIPVEAPRLVDSTKFLLEGADGRLHGVFVPGYPLFLAPFVRLRSLLLAAVVTSVLLGLAHWLLARTVLRARGAVALSLALAAPTYARAIETADALSHGFVAALWALAWTLTLRLAEKPRLREGALLGLSLGWIAATRLLDGLVLGVAAAAVLLPALARRRVTVAPLALAVLCALPFVGLVARSQRVATGSWRKPVVVAYVERSDWPPTCVRLGLGRDIGCGVEHHVDRESFGPDGYTWDDALRLVCARTGVHGSELAGLALLLCAGLLCSARWPDARRAQTMLPPVLLTVAYGGFYFGNSPLHGARHLFAAAPLTLTVLAGALWDAGSRLRPATPERGQGALAFAVLLAALAAQPARWITGLVVVHTLAAPRIDVTAALERAHLRDAVVVVPEVHSHVLHWDPWRTDGVRVVPDDGASLTELRRYRGAQPWWVLDAQGTLLRLGAAVPPEGLTLEWERAWPSFTYPRGLGVAPVALPDGAVLFLFEVAPDASVSVPFELPGPRTLQLRLTGLQSDDYGDWSLRVDGEPVLEWQGYAPSRRRAQSEWSAPRVLAAGAHRASLHSIGKDPRSRALLGAFDVLEGQLSP